MTQQQSPFNMPDETNQFDPQDIQANSVIAGFAYILFFLPLIAAPQSKYARFHANQALLVALLCVAVSILYSILTFALWFIWYIIGIIFTVAYIAVGVYAILGMINGFTGKAKELPLIGKIRIIK